MPMPAFGKLKFVVAAGIFAAAWIFFSQPGRRVLEGLGVYTECAIDVWSLRRHCGNPPEPSAERSPSAFEQADPSTPPTEERAASVAAAQAPQLGPPPLKTATHPANAGPGADVPPQPPANAAPLPRELTPQVVSEAQEVDRCIGLWNSATHMHMAKNEWRLFCMRLRQGATVPASR